jgi:hypothetical protein
MAGDAQEGKALPERQQKPQESNRPDLINDIFHVLNAEPDSVFVRAFEQFNPS